MYMCIVLYRFDFCVYMYIKTASEITLPFQHVRPTCMLGCVICARSLPYTVVSGENERLLSVHFDLNYGGVSRMFSTIGVIRYFVRNYLVSI